MPEVLYDERPRYPLWARWAPLVLAVVALLGLAGSMFLGGRAWVPDSPPGWLLIGVAVLGFIAFFAMEAGDLSWMPGGRDGVRITDEALHLGDSTFRLDELTGLLNRRGPDQACDGRSGPVAVAVVDLASATVTDVRPLGLKDHSVEGAGLDPSDRDDAIAIGTWRVLRSEVK